MRPSAVSRWLVAAMTVGVAQAAADQPPKRPAPPQRAAVVRTVRFAPRAGNSVRPMRIAMDSARHRAYVLNGVKHNLSVVDVHARRVVAIVPLPAMYSSTESAAALFYDRRSDRILVAVPDSSNTGDTHLVTVAAATLKVAATRRMDDFYLRDAALDPGRGRLYLLAQGIGNGPPPDLVAVSVRTLETRATARLRTEARLVAVAERAGLLLTAELRANDIQSRQDQQCAIVARRLADGREVARSHRLFMGPLFLLVDEAGGRAIVCHQGPGPGRSDAAAVLPLPTLTPARDLPVSWPRSLKTPTGAAFAQAALDPAHDRLLVELDPMAGAVAVGAVDLAGHPAPAPWVPATPSYQPWRIGAVDPKGRFVLTTYENGIRAYDIISGRPLWRVATGADIQIARLDRQRHRLFVGVVADRARLGWVSGRRAGWQSSTSEEWTDRAILDIDLRAGWIYFSRGGLQGGGLYLLRMSLAGVEDRAYDGGGGDRLVALRVGRQSGRSYRLYFPIATDVSEPLAWVDTYEGRRRVAHQEVGTLPDDLFYVPASDTLYLVRQRTLAPIVGGAVVHLPGRAPQAHPGESPPAQDARLLDSDAAGRFVYYANPADRVLYKVRLADGAAVASRALPFTPAMVQVDDGAGLIHLVDWEEGKVVSVRAF